MFHSVLFLGSLPFLLSLVNASVIKSRQTSATQIANLASTEDVAVRPNGQILATNMNSPVLNAVDPVTKASTAAISVTGSAGLSGIVEVAPDVFAVIGGQPQGTSVYKIDFSGGDTPTQSLIAKIDGAGNMNGITLLNNDTVLLGDAGKGCVYSLTLSTGEYETAISDPTMAPSGGIPFGIDGLIYKDGVVWYTNIFKNSFHKVEVDEAGKAKGAVTTIWTNLMGDDMCFGPNGKLYLATNGGNSLVEIDTENPATPKTITSVSGSTSCIFGRTEQDENIAYVGSGRGIFAVTV